MEATTTATMDNEQQVEGNWSEAVEDLVAAGEIESAISLLESVISKLEMLNSESASQLQLGSANSSESASQLQLVSALIDLAKLYSSKGFSLKADELEARATLIKQRARQIHPSGDGGVVKDSKVDRASSTNAGSSSNSSVSHGHFSKPEEFPAETSAGNGSSDDDWEAIADRASDELLPSQCLSAVSDLKLDNTKGKTQTPKRRGRGTFSYEKSELYSDQVLDNSVIEVGDEETDTCSEVKRDMKNSKYGTRHVLVLADFSPSTRTIDLEKLFDDFKDQVVIRWVSDTVALAVFQMPSIAHEARSSIHFPFSVRILDEDDTLLSSIKARDLEPPRQRPKTSAQAAQRLIAQGMGLKLSSATFGSRELRKQEDARKNRIVTRQKLRDEAWGD